MYPSDSWLSLLNFYLIVCSGDLDLTTNQFRDERLAQAYQADPSERREDMERLAEKLVLEFQAQKANRLVAQ